MLSEYQKKEIRKKALIMFKKAHIPLTQEEKNRIQIVDYQTIDFYIIGAVMLTVINTERYGGRYILFFPGQSCAQHWHPDVGGIAGKEETFRLLWGNLYAYSKGQSDFEIHAKIPEGKEGFYTCRKEVEMNPGDQFTTSLHSQHWFQAGEKGAIGLEVSSRIRDEYDQASDPDLKGVVYTVGE